MARVESIKLTDLLVNTENYRFETISGQKEAIDKMIENQEEKLYNLAEHIVKNGPNPNDKIQVVASSHDKSKYIVLEGNRRIIALKLLENPELIDNPKYLYLKRKFKRLNAESSGKLVNDIELTPDVNSGHETLSHAATCLA
jgi:hypothetical protein